MKANIKPMENLNRKQTDKLHFSISELCITREPLPVQVADKLLKYHIEPMQVVRLMIGSPIWASQASGYRPEKYELNRGRSGKSQHCFRGKGAVDWTCKDIERMIELIIDNTDYSRICWYPHNRFVHCDYKYAEKGRFFYKCDSPTAHWIKIRKL